MKHYFYIIFYLLSINIISCSYFENEQNYINVKAIEYQQDITSVEHTFENQFLILNPADIINVSDKYLIISDSNADGFIKVFKLPELDFLYSWGQQGQGPNEFQYIPLNEINTVDNKIIFYEIGTRFLRVYEVNDTTLTPVIEYSLKFEGQTNTLTGITRVKDDLYIAENAAMSDETNDELIALQPNNDKPLFYLGNFPNTQLSGFDKLYEYIKTTNASDDGSKIALFYLYHNKFKIFDSNGNLSNKYSVNDRDITHAENELMKFQFRSIKHASNDYLYLMGMYEYGEEIRNNIETFKTTFEKWDWDGNQIHRAKFDRPVHNFTVSEKYGKIYAYSHLEMNSIFEFTIP